MTRKPSLFQDPRRVLGLAFIFAVAIIWVCASFVVQGIQHEGVNTAVLTFISNSLFVVYLPVYWLNLRLRRRLAAAKSDQEQAALMAGTGVRSDAMVEPLAVPAAESSKDGAADMTWRQLLRVALVVRGHRGPVGWGWGDGRCRSGSSASKRDVAT